MVYEENVPVPTVPCLIPSEALKRCWIEDEDLLVSSAGCRTSGVSDLGEGVTPVSWTWCRESKVPGNLALVDSDSLLAVSSLTVTSGMLRHRFTGELFLMASTLLLEMSLYEVDFLTIGDCDS